MFRKYINILYMKSKPSIYNMININIIKIKYFFYYNLLLESFMPFFL